MTPQYAPAPCDLDVGPLDLESGVRVTCDVGYLCGNFSIPVLDLGAGGSRLVYDQ